MERHLAPQNLSWQQHASLLRKSARSKMISQQEGYGYEPAIGYGYFVICFQRVFILSHFIWEKAYGEQKFDFKLAAECCKRKKKVMSQKGLLVFFLFIQFFKLMESICVYVLPHWMKSNVIYLFIFKMALCMCFLTGFILFGIWCMTKVASFSMKHIDDVILYLAYTLWGYITL